MNNLPISSLKVGGQTYDLTPNVFVYQWNNRFYFAKDHNDLPENGYYAIVDGEEEPYLAQLDYIYVKIIPESLLSNYSYTSFDYASEPSISALYKTYEDALEGKNAIDCNIVTLCDNELGALTAFCTPTGITWDDLLAIGNDEGDNGGVYGFLSFDPTNDNRLRYRNYTYNIIDRNSLIKTTQLIALDPEEE